MKIHLFYHSLLSDWNHGNAHFLRGLTKALRRLGQEVTVWEPQNNWSLQHLVKYNGKQPIEDFREYYPLLSSNTYDPETADYETLTKNADLVIVHEWNEAHTVLAVGKAKAKNGFKLLFHDTHHRSVSDRESMSKYDLRHYDGVLAFGDIIRDIYLREGWTSQAWTFHEAADTDLFHPKEAAKEGDLVWIGNWGDEERTEELQEFLIEPVKKLGLRATIYGVRYPDEALQALESAGIRYGGYLPNYRVPEVFSRYRLTVHVPRRPYVESLPGIPTIRPFEALSCGIPLLCSPWEDSENLFRPGKDFLFAEDGREMTRLMELVLKDPAFANTMAGSGLETIIQKHTCDHRARQLLQIAGIEHSNGRTTSLSTTKTKA